MLNLDDIKSFKNNKVRLLGLDLGDKTIGIALSDVSWIISSPLVLIKRTAFKKDLEQLQEIITKHNICALIIGLPVNMNGTQGSQAEKVLQFVGKMAETITTPIVMWDERLSTMAVTRTLLEADVSRKKRKDVVDKMAACYILQGALDRLSNC